MLSPQSESVVSSLISLERHRGYEKLNWVSGRWWCQCFNHSFSGQEVDDYYLSSDLNWWSPRGCGNSGCIFWEMFSKRGGSIFFRYLCRAHSNLLVCVNALFLVEDGSLCLLLPGRVVRNREERANGRFRFAVSLCVSPMLSRAPSSLLGRRSSSPC